MNKLLEFFSLFRNRVIELVQQVHEGGMGERLRGLAGRRVAVVAGLAALVALAGFSAYWFFAHRKKAPPPKQELVQVKASKARREDYTENYTVMGTIKGAVENELRFEIDGILASYNYRESAHIPRGKVIASLDPKDAFTKTDFARSKYKSEQSAYFSALQRLKVYEELYQMKALSESKLQEARFETQSAEAKVKAALSELELAQSNLAKTNLTAPADGMLTEILIKPGDYITPQDVVARFMSGSGINFEVDIPEKDVDQIKLGLKTKVNCDAYPNRDFWGAVTAVAPMVKERTRTTTVKVALTAGDAFFRTGMFGRGSIILKELKNVMLVPTDSVVSLGGVSFLVPLIKPDPEIEGEGIVEMRVVKPGEKLSKNTVIDDGINPDELIVTETQGQLQDGIRVRYTMKQTEGQDGAGPEAGQPAAVPDAGAGGGAEPPPPQQ